MINEYKEKLEILYIQMGIIKSDETCEVVNTCSYTIEHIVPTSVNSIAMTEV